MYFCLLGFDLNSIYCKVRGVIFTFPISKINVCGHNLLQLLEGRKADYYLHLPYTDHRFLILSDFENIYH